MPPILMKAAVIRRRQNRKCPPVICRAAEAAEAWEAAEEAALLRICRAVTVK